MDPVSRGGTTGEDMTVVELLRLAQVHQQVAQTLLARAERISQDDGPGSRSAPAAPVTGKGEWGLTERESEVTDLLRRGMSNKMIARALRISERTVKNHLYSIFGKLGVVDRTQAVIILMGRNNEQ